MGVDCLDFLVAIVLPLCSFHVSKVPQHVPNSISLDIPCLHTLITYISSPKGGDYKYTYFGTVQTLIKAFCGCQSMLPITKGKKIELWVTHQLINITWSVKTVVLREKKLRSAQKGLKTK
jgi:hypothetical protein